MRVSCQGTLPRWSVAFSTICIPKSFFVIGFFNKKENKIYANNLEEFFTFQGTQVVI